MMYKLRIVLLDEISSYDEGKLIKLILYKDKEKFSIFHGKVNVSEFILWMKDNESNIRYVDLPDHNCSIDSIAYYIHEFYEKIDVDNESLIDMMFEYRASHCFKFAARGVNFPEIYIGKSGENYELSLYTNKGEWRYLIDIDDFFTHILH